MRPISNTCLLKQLRKKIQMRIKKSIILKICKNYVLLCNKFFAKMGTQLFYSLIKIFFFQIMLGSHYGAICYNHPD